jgi:excisionase family DNA binding protein
MAAGPAPPPLVDARPDARLLPQLARGVPQDATMNEEHFLTTEEVLDYLQVNLRTIYRLIKAGKIPAVRVGRQWRFRKKDIDAWLTGARSGGRAAGGAGVDRPRILIVDDEQAVRELVAKTLTMADYDVDTAADGPSAIDRLKSTDYDLLITDLKMPGMDGLSVIREARQKSAELPIIIITGYSTEASAIEAINLGVCGYLTKPFRLPRVLAVAARALGEPTPAVEA